MTNNNMAGEPAAMAMGAGSIPDTNIVVVQSISYGTVIEGGGKGNAPAVNINIDLNDRILADISQVTVTLRGEDGSTHQVSAQTSDNEDLENFLVELSSQAVSGTYEISSISITFAGDPAVTGYPENGLSLGADEISSLMPDRFIELTNVDEDRTPPELHDLELPTRSIVIDNDLPNVLGGGNSVEITFMANVTDDNSGLNVIEFEFDIGPNSPAVIGASLGIFGDLSEGEKQLSTYNTEAPAGTYVFELFRVSDDQGNSLVYTADDLAAMGYQNSVHVVTREALQDATSPTVNAFNLGANSVDIGADGGTLAVTLNATDSGVGATGVQSLTIVLTNASGSRYQLEADVEFGSGNNATATFQFPADFPSGEFTIERLSVNDGAYNREDISLSNSTLIVDNPYGGDVTNNNLRGDASDNLIVGRAGADTLIGGDGNDTLSLGDGDDISYAGPGDTGDDSIIGGAGNDLIGGGAGDDFIVGGQGITYGVQTLLFRDLEQRLDGSDTLYGGAGEDTIYGGSPRLLEDADDTAYGTDRGSIAPDTIYSGADNDWVQASFGADTLGGGQGADTLQGGAGNDVIYGGRGDVGASGINDVISGQDGHDTIFASGGDDSVSGGADNDLIYGGVGDDILSGDGGHDQIFGGTGNDTITGGTGEDRFNFAPGSGIDVITDFDATEDTLVLSAYSERIGSIGQLVLASSVTTVDGTLGLLIDLGEGDQLFLAGVTTTSALFDVVL